MKKLAFLLLAVSPFAAMAQAEKRFELKGILDNVALPVQKVFIRYQAKGTNVYDSVVVKNNKYSFKGSITEAVRVNLGVKYAPGADGKPVKLTSARDYTTVFLTPAKNITVTSTDSFSNVKVKGSPAHEEYNKLTALLKPVTDQQTILYAEYSKATAAKDEAARKAAEDKIDALDPDIKKIYGDYLKANPTSLIALYALNQYAGWDINAETAGPVFASLPQNVQTSASGKIFADKLDLARKLAVGQPALDFTQNDTLGIPVSLSSLKGKYILVDFWASWCGPCRRENPNVVKAFNNYKDKGFSILSVSLDQPGAKDKWIEAIHKDNLTWTHVSDLKYWENEVAKQYGIQAIPQNYLVDPQGKIVAKNLSGENLEKKLAEFISK